MTLGSKKEFLLDRKFTKLLKILTFKYKYDSERSPILTDYNTYQPLNEIFTIGELKAVLKRSKNISPGSDGIHYEMLKNLPGSGLLRLLYILNKVLDSGHFPKIWKESIVIPILKPSLEVSDHTALTSCFLQTFKRILNKRLVWFIEMNNLLSAFLCGFKKNYSSLDLILNLESEILNAFMNNQNLLAVPFNIKKVFSCVWRWSILSEMAGPGIQG